MLKCKEMFSNTHKDTHVVLTNNTGCYRRYNVQLYVGLVFAFSVNKLQIVFKSHLLPKHNTLYKLN